MKIKKMRIEDIQTAHYNPRKISDKAYKALRASLNRFGLVEPLIFNDKTNTLVGGHQRLKILIEEDVTETDVVVVSLDEVDEKALNITLNNKNIMGEFNSDLKSLLNELSTQLPDFDEFGLDELTVDKEIKKYTPQDINAIGIATDRLHLQRRAKNGDIYKLNNNILYCGDAFSDDYHKYCNDIKFVFIDPPFEIRFGNKYNELFNKIKLNNSNIFYMCDDLGIIDYLRNSELDFVGFLITDFTFSQPRPNNAYLRHILISHEKKGENQTFLSTNDGFSTILKIKYRNKLNERVTPYQKDAKLIYLLIDHYTKKNDRCLDVFSGSGNMLLVCEQLKRSCVSIEKDVEMCDIIINRWEQLTSKKAEKVN